MSSISSCLISNFTSFRNPNGPEQVWTKKIPRDCANPFKVVLAEVGYLLVIPFAVIEAALSFIAKLFSCCLPIGQVNHDTMTTWFQSSAFSVVWSLANATINVICNDMIETERVARACASSGNIFRVPSEAL